MCTDLPEHHQMVSLEQIILSSHLNTDSGDRADGDRRQLLLTSSLSRVPDNVNGLEIKLVGNPKRTGRQNAWVEVLSCSPTVKECRKHPGKITRPETQMI